MGIGTLMILLAIIVLLFLSGCFSLSETALTGTSKARILQLQKAGDVRARILLPLIELRESVVAAILVGNNLVNVFASALLTSLLIVSVGESGVFLATLTMTAAIVIFGEIMPKGYALRHPELSALRFSAFIAACKRVFSLPARGFVWIARSTMRLLGIDGSFDNLHLSAHDEIRGAVDLMHREGGVVKDDRDMLGGILDLRSRTVSDVMVHRTKMATLNAQLPVPRLIEEITSSPYTRLPLWRGEPENIVGVVHAKDVLRKLERLGNDRSELAIEKLAATPWFVPETTTLAGQLHAFKRRKSHFALAVDEYGVVMGLVTLEDIIEEIVGEISDEHDIAIAPVRRERNGSLVVDGGTAVRDLNRLLDWSLPEGDATTVAGLVIHEAKMIPQQGQTFTFHGMRFEILRRQRTRLATIRISPVRERPPGAYQEIPNANVGTVSERRLPVRIDAENAKAKAPQTPVQPAKR